jgi:hypothetical protein
MGRPPKVRDNQLPADVTWDESAERWIATVVGPDGAKITTPPQHTTTQAVSRIELLLRERYQRAIAVEPKVQIPKQLRPRYQTYSRKLPAFNELTAYIKTERRDLAVELTEKYQVPLRTVAQLLGWSPQRLGAILNEWTLSQTEAAKPRRKRKVEGDE